MKSKGKRTVCLCATLAMCMGMEGGCPWRPPPPPDFSSLAGTWSVTRGDVHLKFTWTTGDGGQTQTDSSGGTLQPIDVNQFPEALRPLAEQWNNGLAELNAALDAAFPAEIVVTFPHPYTVKFQDAADLNRMVTGAIDREARYLFAGDLSGGGQGSDQGGGAVLSIASIDGHFDVDALTTEGKVARTLIVVLIGQQGGAILTAQVSVEYTAQRTGDVPTTQPSP